MGLLRQSEKLGLPLMNLVRFKGMPILDQLNLEEKLLRTTSDNWCIVNDGANAPTVVMGVSGKPAELLELESVIGDNVPVIKRFTGGGTVIVDEGTIFVTLICNKDAVPKVQPYPRSIMSWSGKLYDEVFQGIGDFQLRENGKQKLSIRNCFETLPSPPHYLFASAMQPIFQCSKSWCFVLLPDYVFGNRKFGGNAQSITKDRWIHHTSFLWDYEDRNMTYLKLPSRAPEYRSARDHTEFVCRMREYLQRSAFIDKTIKALDNYFMVQPATPADVNSCQVAKFAHSTRLLSKQELEDACSSTKPGTIAQSASI
ncbi:unnamed protein product [Linum tenue]|uniref:BPL/LPL catalytic domain-containing protein n=1 Tax=Linum tenue TaxID=586396 RepID=A0AAV0N6F8_9ROSI|nr:unnamed protein product [Linum tenue]